MTYASILDISGWNVRANDYTLIPTTKYALFSAVTSHDFSFYLLIFNDFPDILE